MEHYLPTKAEPAQVVVVAAVVEVLIPMYGVLMQMLSLPVRYVPIPAFLQEIPIGLIHLKTKRKVVFNV